MVEGDSGQIFGSGSERGQGWLREFVEFALDFDISAEIEEQQRELERSPNWARGHYNLGVLYNSQGRLEEAMKEFFIAIECDPAGPAPYRRLGELYVKLGDFEKGGVYAILAADRGDPGLRDSFRRYSTLAKFVERPVTEESAGS